MPLSLRSALPAALALAVLAALPLACQSGGVGDPCTPEDEHDSHFAGFDVGQTYIESRSFQCATRLCIVNHFQGRVSCPLGQAAADVQDCGGPGGAEDALCDAARGERCEESGDLSVPCDPRDPASCAALGLTCDGARGLCVCGPDTVPQPGYHCSVVDGVSLPRRFVCHVPGSCQTAEGSAAANAGKACCLPGTGTPVDTPVCGQCAPASHRAAAEAVYCSCRCDVADGKPPDPSFNFCTCPSGFTCSEIRPDYDITDHQLTGKYCIKEGSAYAGTPASCGAVAGNHEAPCQGLGAP
jgi:hypothetical protein